MQDTTVPFFLADCHARLAIEVVSGRWTVLVLHALSRRPRRHGELVELIGGISRKVLTQTLRRLQGYGLVERRAYKSRRIEYRLTDLGRTLTGPIETLTAWAREHGEEVADFSDAARKHRSDHDQSA